MATAIAALRSVITYLAIILYIAIAAPTADTTVTG